VSGPRRLAAAYVVCALIFLATDSVWLTLASERLYHSELGDLLAPQPRLGAAVMFYLIYIAGVVGFAIAPALQSGGARRALVRGAALGLVAYATYDLTNQATLAMWSTKLTVIDLAWGTSLTGLSAAATAAVLGRIRGRAS
jgi:uncharacterized membrane protein